MNINQKNRRRITGKVRLRFRGRGNKGYKGMKVKKMEGK